jgi:hypothetical protein
MSKFKINRLNVVVYLSASLSEFSVICGQTSALTKFEAFVVKWHLETSAQIWQIRTHILGKFKLHSLKQNVGEIERQEVANARRLTKTFW